MACKNDITLACSWLALSDPGSSLPELGLAAQSPDPTDALRDPDDAQDPLEEYPAVMSLGRFLQ
jgi:hypothetical protein